MDERHLPPLGLANAWGYNPVNFFALDPRLAPGGRADLSALCRTYAEAGIGVILDIVFNHTAESDEFGATICLRGLDNAVYYRHAADDPGRLVNDTGCGHTLALDRAPAVRMAMDALRAWRRLGVAGFRFDLGTVMGRNAQGFTPDAPLLSAILQDPELSQAILIAEPWDVGPAATSWGASPRLSPNGTAAIATMSAASGAAMPGWRERWRRGWPAPPTSSRRSSRATREHQLHRRP